MWNSPIVWKSYCDRYEVHIMQFILSLIMHLILFASKSGGDSPMRKKRSSEEVLTENELYGFRKRIGNYRGV